MEITAQCNCGNDLNQTEVKLSYGDPVLVVEPCQDCLDEEHAKGVTEGEENAS